MDNRTTKQRIPAGQVVPMGVDIDRLLCESKRECDDQPCSHPAKYLVPYDSRVVCGVHARAFLRCIPLADIEAAPSGRPT